MLDDLQVETADMVGRQAILDVHVTKKELPFRGDIDPANIACMTIGFTGADLENLEKEKDLLAGRENKVFVSNSLHPCSVATNCEEFEFA
ncbi:ATP-dependent zinc metalloprotease FTSH 9, chloroplastic [Artemisia annua]|uniref:ATP-dependent zinc metalloprotease FTSH 9, chloroplastic n=1 Tax=Artemisia annua TaxID=35608 RepID=A0A2U1M704_ARTAN|nr:ATP-dependent zinc metalloprotease FTSH 9, chloroplastic [Artemisia annua]